MDKKLHDLLEAAVEKTERGGLEWTAFDSESFRAKIGTGYLHIQRSSTRMEDDDIDSPPRTTYSVQVSDSQGRVVAEGEGTEGYEGYASCNRLFQVARKAALSSDRVIDDMLQTLRGGSRA